MKRIGHVGLVFFVLSSIFQPLLSAGTLASENHDDHVHHHKNEIGVSLGYVYLDPEDDSAPGFHLHYMRRLQGKGIQRYFGLGLGLETIFAEHKHYNAMISLGVYPYRNLVVIISPGVLFVEHLEEYETRYSTHIEVAYGFMIGHFEIGPVLGYAQSEDDKHYMLGIHLGRGF